MDLSIARKCNSYNFIFDGLLQICEYWLQFFSVFFENAVVLTHSPQSIDIAHADELYNSFSLVREPRTSFSFGKYTTTLMTWNFSDS